MKTVYSAEEIREMQKAKAELLEALQYMLNITEPTARPRKGDMEATRERAFKVIKKVANTPNTKIV